MAVLCSKGGLTLCRFAYPTLWAVVVGMMEQPVNGAQYLSVEKIFYHSRYRPKGLDYDIALMKLLKPLIFNGNPPAYVFILLVSLRISFATMKFRL